MNTLTYLILFSACSFLFFGWACFFNSHMKLEYTRYGFPSFRKIVGGLQLMGGSGLLLGIFNLPLLQVIAAGGLSILMILGFLVRLKIRDSFLQTAPSLFYALLNAYILYKLLPLL